MLEELNFEIVYEEIQSSSTYGPEEKSAVTEAVWRAYKQMHGDMSDRSQFGPSGANAVGQLFLGRFASADSRERGFIFTLNQDLLVEAFGRPRGGGLTYIKLHGSFEWRGANESRAIVIGTNKGKMLSAEPLLKWYQEMFWEARHEKDRSLLVIGYSFRDSHINDVILSAVRSVGLKLLVMSPAAPDEFRATLLSVDGTGAVYIERGQELWQALHGYYRGSVTDYYVPNHIKLRRIGALI
jgi:SIR2-like domain